MHTRLSKTANVKALLGRCPAYNTVNFTDELGDIARLARARNNSVARLVIGGPRARDKLEAQYEAGVMVNDDEATKPPPSCVDVSRMRLKSRKRGVA